MKNNKLSIYREVLTFSCDILDLQEELDKFIILLRFYGYDICCKEDSYSGLYYVRIKCLKGDLTRLIIDFTYDDEYEYIEEIQFYYEENGSKKMDGSSIKELIEELNKLEEII